MDNIIVASHKDMVGRENLTYPGEKASRPMPLYRFIDDTVFYHVIADTILNFYRWNRCLSDWSLLDFLNRSH